MEVKFHYLHSYGFTVSNFVNHNPFFPHCCFDHPGKLTSLLRALCRLKHAFNAEISGRIIGSITNCCLKSTFLDPVIHLLHITSARPSRKGRQTLIFFAMLPQIFISSIFRDAVVPVPTPYLGSCLLTSRYLFTQVPLSMFFLVGLIYLCYITISQLPSNHLTFLPSNFKFSHHIKIHVCIYKQSATLKILITWLPPTRK